MIKLVIMKKKNCKKLYIKKLKLTLLYYVDTYTVMHFSKRITFFLI